MGYYVVPKDGRVVVADLGGFGSFLCVSMSAGALTLLYRPSCKSATTTIFKSSDRDPQWRWYGNHTESFLLRRMNSGPGFKAAFTIGTTAIAANRGVLENFMVLFRFRLLLRLSFGLVL